MDTPIKDRPVAGSIAFGRSGGGQPGECSSASTGDQARSGRPSRARTSPTTAPLLTSRHPATAFTPPSPTALVPSGYAKTRQHPSMAAPHITGIAALIKATHHARSREPDHRPHAQASGPSTARLEVPPTTGIPRLRLHQRADRMRRDQMQPTVTTLEYRIGKGEWKSTRRRDPARKAVASARPPLFDQPPAHGRGLPDRRRPRRLRQIRRPS